MPRFFIPLLAILFVYMCAPASAYYCSIYDECYDCIDNNCKWCMNSSTGGSCHLPLESPTCTYFENNSACPYDRMISSAAQSDFLDWLTKGDGWERVGFVFVLVVGAFVFFIGVPLVVFLVNLGVFYGRKYVQKEIRKRRLQRVQPLEEIMDSDL